MFVSKVLKIKFRNKKLPNEYASDSKNMKFNIAPWNTRNRDTTAKILSLNATLRD